MSSVYSFNSTQSSSVSMVEIFHQSEDGLQRIDVVYHNNLAMKYQYHAPRNLVMAVISAHDHNASVGKAISKIKKWCS